MARLRSEDQPFERARRQRELQEPREDRTRRRRRRRCRPGWSARAARGRSRGRRSAKSRPVAIEKPAVFRSSICATSPPTIQRIGAGAVGLALGEVAAPGRDRRADRERRQRRRRSRRGRSSGRRGRTAPPPASPGSARRSPRRAPPGSAAMTSAARSGRPAAAPPAPAHCTRPMSFRIAEVASMSAASWAVEGRRRRDRCRPSPVGERLLPGLRLHHLLDVGGDRRLLLGGDAGRGGDHAPVLDATSTPASLKRRRIDARDPLLAGDGEERAARRPRSGWRTRHSRRCRR